MKKSEIKALIKEVLTEAATVPSNVVKKVNETFNSPEEAIEYLKNLALTDELGKEAIDDLHAELLSSRRKMFTKQKSPEQKKATAEKAKLTKIQNQKDLEDFRQKFKKEEEDDRINRAERKRQNLLPLETDNYSLTPSPEYYIFDYKNFQNGVNNYKLKKQYKNTPVSKDIADKYWRV
jgi:hypothetical protein